MPMLLAHPTLLAVDVDTIIAVVVMVFWFLGWIIKLATSQSQKGPPVVNRPRPPARPRDEKLQEEIDIFIKDVNASRPTRPAAASTSRPLAPQAGTRQAPLRPGQGQPRPAPSRPAPASTALPAKGRGGKRASQQPPKTVDPAPQPRKPSRRIRPGQEIAERHVAGTENLGSGVQQHLKQYMAETVSQEVATHLQHNVDASVREHLGTTLAATPPAAGLAASSAPSTASARVMQLFQNPATLRQAMVISLILSPPRGRRPGSAH